MFRCNLTLDCVFSVEALRRILDSSITRLSCPSLSWIKKVPIKIICFVWKAKLGRIPIVDELKIRDANIQSPCFVVDSILILAN